MADFCITSQLVKKIGHPIQEIRERALDSVYSKLEYGIQFDDKYRRSKELLGLLLRWLKYENSKYQNKVLEIIYNILNLPSGKTLVNHISSRILLNDFSIIRQNIEDENMKDFDNIVQCVKNLNTSVDGENSNFSHLELPRSSESEPIDRDSYVSTSHHSANVSNKTNFNNSADPLTFFNEVTPMDLLSQGIKVYLLPWCQLCDMDTNTISMIEDALSTDHSAERTIVFLIDILLKDFPSELFLNRPSIIKSLYKMLNSLGQCLLSLEALYALCTAINRRLQQLQDPDLRDSKKSSVECSNTLSISHHVTERSNSERMIDCESALSQIPLPLFCLETMYIIINFLGQGIPQISSHEHNIAVYSMRELNAAMNLCFEANNIFMNVVTSKICNNLQCSKITQQISQKLIILLRSLGDLLNRYRISAIDDASNPMYRITYLRLLSFGLTLAKWSEFSSLIPSSFVSSLVDSLTDISCLLLHPHLYEDLLNIVKGFDNSNVQSNEKLKMYLEADTIRLAMNITVNFLKNYDSLRKSSHLMKDIKESLPALEFHKNINYLYHLSDIFSVEILQWSMERSVSDDVRYITLTLLSHAEEWVQEEFYTVCHNIVQKVLGGDIKMKNHLINEKSLLFLLHPSILIEISSHGLHSESSKVQFLAVEIIQHLLRGKLLVSNNMWRKILEALLPAMPYIHVHAAHDNTFGQSVLKTLDIQIGQCMLIPNSEMILGNTRLLFTKCFTAQMEGSLNLRKFLSLQEDSENLLPKLDCLRPDVLCTTIRSVNSTNFNVIKHGDSSFYEKGSLLHVITLLKNNKSFKTMNNEDESDHFRGGDSTDVDPSFVRSALAQLAVMLQQTSLHETFLTNDGCKIITHYLSTSLSTQEFSCFPEVAVSCVSLLNSLCYVNATIRHWASEQPNLLLNIIRVIFLFPNEEGFTNTVSQLLCLLSFAQVISNSCSVEDPTDGDLSLPHSIVKKTNLPFRCAHYSTVSPHRKPKKRDMLMNDPWTSSFLRVSWCTAWYEGVDNVVRWPYVPDSHNADETFASSLMMTSGDLSILRSTSPLEGCVASLYQIQNATSHKMVNKALDTLNGYVLLTHNSKCGMKDFDMLPWQGTFSRFIASLPASPKDSLLLLNIIKCLSTYMRALIQNDCRSLEFVSWLFDFIFNTSRGTMTILIHAKSDDNWTDSSSDQIPTKLRQSIVELICDSCLYTQNLKDEEMSNNIKGDNIKWGYIIEHLIKCLLNIDIYDYYSLAYVGQIVKCLSYLTYLPKYEICIDTRNALIKNFAKILSISFIGDGYVGYKGTALVQNSFITLCQMLENSLRDKERMKFWLENSIQEERNENILLACLLWHHSNHTVIRCLSLKLLTGLATQPPIVSHLSEKFEESNKNIMLIVINQVIDLNEASLVREQAAILLNNLLSSKVTRHLGMKFFDSRFYDKMSTTITKVCINDYEEIESGDNIALEIFSNREVMEVANSKKELSFPLKQGTSFPPKCSLRLLTALTDVLFNILLYVNSIPVDMVNSGILRFLFKCITLKVENSETKLIMIAALCRTLHKAANMSLDIHSTLTNAEDCVSALLRVFSLKYAVLRYQRCKTATALCEMWKWALYFIGTLIETKNGFSCVWRIISENGMLSFFHVIHLSISDQEYKDNLSSALYCLINLLSADVLFVKETNQLNMQLILDKTLTSSLNIYKNISSEIQVDQINKKILNSCDSKCRINEDANSNGLVLSESLCKSLLDAYKIFISRKNIAGIIEEDRNSITSGLCCLFTASDKARLFAVNKGFIQDKIDYLSEIQYTIMTDTKALEVIQRRGTHPILQKLDWTIQLLCNVMVNCSTAKEQCVIYNLVVPLNKLWPWCMSTNEIKHHTVQLLCVYTNSCAKASQSMHQTVGVKCLILEIIELIGKEMNHISRQRSLVVLQGCLQILENISSHIHCRAVILKSEVLNHLNKLHPAVTRRQPQWREVESMWETFVVGISRFPEGQLRVAEYLGVLCALVHQADGLMLPVLRNCSFNAMNKPRLLGSAELLNIFSTILTSDRSLSDKLTVCGALWALAANHHKSKLSLRTAGLTAKLTECLHMLKYTTDKCQETDRAVQIITYVLKVITIT